MVQLGIEMQAAALVTTLLFASDALGDRASLERALIDLEAETKTLLKEVHGRRGTLGLGREDDVLLESARAELAAERKASAMAMFLDAAKDAKDDSRLVPAFEGFVMVAKDVRTVGELPPIERYARALSYDGRLDGAAQETLYDLGKILVMAADPRARDVLAPLDLATATGRRARYLLGTLALRLEEVEIAAQAFVDAAQAPAEPGLDETNVERDRDVRELALLAVGRVAFEVGDLATGVWAYQQIPTDSRHFADAFFELGWVSMRAGDDATALDAFSSLIDALPDAEVTQRARLLRGYARLTAGDDVGAERLYRQVAQSFANSASALEDAVSSLPDLADLARNCETRTRALANSILSPLASHPKVSAALALADEHVRFAATVPALRAEATRVGRVLALDGEHNPLRRLARQIQQAETLLLRASDLLQNLEQGALRTGRRADTSAATSAPCCKEPRGRLVAVAERLEETITHLRTVEGEVRQKLLALQVDLEKSATEHERDLARLTENIVPTQRALVREAADELLAELRFYQMEGEAGVLEAVWRWKEKHRDSIAAMEQERKRAIEALDLPPQEEQEEP